MEQINQQSPELGEQSQSPESSPSESPQKTCTESISGEQADAIIEWSASQAKKNADRRAVVGPACVGPVLAKEGIHDRIAAFRAKLADPETDRRAQEADEAQRRRDLAGRIDRIIAASGVPPKYAGAWPQTALDRLPESVAAIYGQKFQALETLARRPVVIGLIGTVGPGKTWMACALVNAHCRAGISAEYHEVSDFFIDVKETFGHEAKTRQSVVEAAWFAPQLLILDEMQERGDTPWEDRMVTRLVNKRYAMDKTTVLVSNQGKEAFEARAGGRIMDRINDDGGMIVCDWPSLRGQITPAAK